MSTTVRRALTSRRVGVTFLIAALLSGSAAVTYASDAAPWIAGGVAAIILADVLTRPHHSQPPAYREPPRVSYRATPRPAPRPVPVAEPYPRHGYTRPPAARPVYRTGNPYDVDLPVPMEVKVQRLRGYLNRWLRQHPNNGTAAWRWEYDRFVGYQNALLRENDYRLQYGTEPPFRGQDYNGYGHWDGVAHDGFDYRAVYGPDWQRMRAYAASVR